MNAEPCTRRCPVGIRSFRHNRFLYRQAVGFDIPMGQHTPMKYVNTKRVKCFLCISDKFVLSIRFSAYGSYCLKDNGVPFCPTEANGVGDVRCCIGANSQNVLDDASFRSSNSIETMVDFVKGRDRS